MITINLENPLIDLDGKIIPNTAMHKIVANLFCNSRSHEPAKFLHWAQELWAKKQLQVDKVDKEKIMSTIRDAEGLTNIAKAQILAALEVGAVNGKK